MQSSLKVRGPGAMLNTKFDVV